MVVTKFLLILLIIFLLSCSEDNKIEFCSQKIGLDKKIIWCINQKDLDLSALKYFQNLEYIDISGSKIKKFIDLKSVKKLKKIVAIDTNIDKFIENSKQIIMNKEILNFELSKQFSTDRVQIISDKNKVEIEEIPIELGFYTQFQENSEVLKFYSFDEKLFLDNLDFLFFSKSVEELYLPLKNDKLLESLVNLFWLKKLTLVGKNIKMIKKLPKNIEKLVLLNCSIDDFSFVKDLKILKELEIITENMKNYDYKSIIKYNPNIKVTIKDSNIFTPNININAFCGFSNDIYEKKIFLEDIKITPFKLKGVFRELQNCKEELLISYLRECIENNDFESIVYYGNRFYLEYILNNYSFASINTLNKSGKTILDKIIENNRFDIMDILIKHGAKRSCEILKTECK